MANKRKRTASCKLPREKGKTVEKKTPRPSPERDDGSPVRAIACLKMVDDMKRFDDCFILEFDPYELVSLWQQLPLDLNAPPPLGQDDAVDLSVIAEKGQCYCFVCDLAAPCQYWTIESHCNAKNADHWKAQREVMRKCKK